MCSGANRCVCVRRMLVKQAGSMVPVKEGGRPVSEIFFRAIRERLRKGDGVLPQRVRYEGIYVKKSSMGGGDLSGSGLVLPKRRYANKKPANIKARMVFLEFFVEKGTAGGCDHSTDDPVMRAWRSSVNGRGAWIFHSNATPLSAIEEREAFPVCCGAAGRARRSAVGEPCAAGKCGTLIRYTKRPVRNADWEGL